MMPESVMLPPASIRENYAAVTARIHHACARAGRDPGEVCLVCVTKTVGVPEMQTLLGLGARDLGENRVHLAQQKFPALAGSHDLRRHFIGHMQRNKVRNALQHFDFFHSVDSHRLAREMEKEAARAGLSLPILAQVNVAGETQKHGFSPEELPEALREINDLEHLELQGLMTMAPIAEDAEQVRPVFRRLRELRDSLARTFPGLVHLSMGMTQDFEVAIEEGATFVRVGSALFRGGPPL